MNLSEILAASGVSNKVIADPGSIKDKPVRKTGQSKLILGKTYPQGINHAKRLFYTLRCDGVIWDLELPTFFEAKLLRDENRAIGRNVQVVSVTEVDYI